MPIHLRDNQYRGVNAHLQSFLQTPGKGWEMFHAAHITHLTDVIDALLPDGYYVLNEKSLQLSTLDFETGERGISRTRPDMSIYGEPIAPSSSFGIGSMPTATLPLMKIIVEDDPLPSTIIYKAESDGQMIPVTRLELLSPGNKPPGTHYRQYFLKRNETLESGINLIEIDYLHETRLPTSFLPSYPDHESGAYPYAILVSRPGYPGARGSTLVYGFHVDDSMPYIAIPLAGDDTITIDFGAVYNTTFSRNRYYGAVAVDYEQLPVRFDTYTPDDQARIRERMNSVIASSKP
jgi:hypothetical protein